jgi:hypothetical protein
MVDPKSLVPNPSNPNRHGKKQLDMYVSILKFQGWRRSVTVSNQSGFVTRGHGALQASLLAGFTSIPVDRQDYESIDAEHADLIADNQLQRMSEMDSEKLTEMLVHLNSGEFNLELTGLPEVKLQALLTGFDAPPPPAPSSAGLPTTGPGSPGGPLSDGHGGSAPPGSSEVRMVQLLLSEQDHVDFGRIVEFYRGELKLGSTPEIVMAVLRSAHEAQTNA